MKINWKIVNRKVHYWGSIIIAIPIIIVIFTGILLLLKKNIEWLQPPTVLGSKGVPTLLMSEVLNISKDIPEVNIQNWTDIERIDFRPKKGLIKIRAKNRWEIQLDHQTGAILHIAYRRSDLIESIHDGTFFHDKVKLWFFLPSAIILLILWITGVYLFFLPILKKIKINK